MAPKKAQKMSLNEFLGDSALGSWADEMDSLPTAPAFRTDEDRSRQRGGDRDYGGRHDGDFSSRDRQSQYPPRQELPLPTAPPYTAFIGNLAFDLKESDIEEFFQTSLKNVKIISDRDGKPKGFGYVEFDSLQALKDGLALSGGQLAGRTVRISVAEPPKERASGGFDDDKFGGGSWRREGPLPSSDRNDRFSARGPPSSRYGDSGDRSDRGERMGFGSKFVPSSSGPENRPPRGETSRFSDAPPGEADNVNDWRSNRPARPPAETSVRPDRSGPPRKTSGFASPDRPPRALDSEESWTMGSKFKPSEPSAPPPGGKRGDFFGKKDARPADDGPSDWRSAPRKAPSGGPTPRPGGFDRSPNDSLPSTPQLGRRKLDMTRSGNESAEPSPVASPRSATAPRPNPFGDAKPVDAAAREREIEEKLSHDRTAKVVERHEQPIKSGFDKKEPGGSRDLPARAPPGDTGSWRERDPTHPKRPSAFSNGRSISGGHSRTTSIESHKSPTTPSTSNKNRGPFSFAAAAAATDVAEGEDDGDEDQTSEAMGDEKVKDAEKDITA